jgi:uncharacterized membrane protein
MRRHPAPYLLAVAIAVGSASWLLAAAPEVTPAAAAEAGAAWPVGYDYEIIDIPGASASAVWRMNARGDFVGVYTTAGRTYSFVSRHGEFEPIVVEGASTTSVRGINDRGDIVGSYFQDGAWRGFLLRNRVVTTVEVPGAALTRLWDISANGTVSGDYQLEVPGTTYTFTWRAGRFTMIDLPNSVMSAGYGINTLGQVVGHYRLADPDAPSGATKMMGFVWRNGAVTHVDHPAAGGIGMSCLQGIGVHGEAVGHYFDPSSTLVYGFIWQGGEFSPPMQAPGAHQTFPLTITPSGVVAGYFISHEGQQSGFIATPRHH